MQCVDTLIQSNLDKKDEREEERKNKIVDIDTWIHDGQPVFFVES
jgi:hypothetical protein